MITDGTSNWYYLAVKSISGLLGRITSNHNGDFYCLNCFHPYTTEKNLRKHERTCNGHDFCHLNMTDEDNKILKYVPGKKSLRVPFIIYSDFCCSFDKLKNDWKYYRGEDCMKIFSKALKDQAIKIINYEKKEMISSTDEEKETHENQKIC